MFSFFEIFIDSCSDTHAHAQTRVEIYSMCLCLLVFLLDLLLSINANVEQWSNHSLFWKVCMTVTELMFNLYIDNQVIT